MVLLSPLGFSSYLFLPPVCILLCVCTLGEIIVLSSERISLAHWIVSNIINLESLK